MTDLHPTLLWPKLVEGSELYRGNGDGYGNGYGYGHGDGSGNGHGYGYGDCGY
jgi:hypothetical protein